ncbi:MAG: OmpA family protein, partial [Acidimicrobiales bacterium]
VAGGADAADAAADAVAAGADGAEDAVADKSSPAAGGLAGRVAGDYGDRGGLGWLWWALGAVILVLLLAWLLSTCNEDTNAGETTTVAADADADGAGGQDTDTDEAADPADDADGVDDADVGPETDADADLQAAADAALEGTGVTAVVSGGVVTLTGTVDGEGARAEAAAMVEDLVGVLAIENEVLVEESDDGDEAGDASDQTDEEGSDEVEAGSTINQLLGLDPVTFAVSSARLTAEGQAVLDEAGAFLEANPDVSVEIGGHTDNDGAEAENLTLSQLRADSVKEYLEGFGIDGARMETKGYGEAEPLVPNDSSLAKAENRRIEFTIL